MVEALVGLKLIDEVVQSFVEFFDHLMVLLKDTEDIGCSPRDLAKKLCYEIVPHQVPRTGFWLGSSLISQSIKIFSPDFFLSFSKTSG